MAVGLAGEKEESAADELLRQLITLPRPVRVEFARTTSAPAYPTGGETAASGLAAAAPLASPSNNSEPLQQAQPVGARPLALGKVHSAGANERTEDRAGEAGEEAKDEDEHRNDKPPLCERGRGQVEEGTHPAHTEKREYQGEGGKTGGNRGEGEEEEEADRHTNGRPGTDSKGKRDQSSRRPQRHGTLPEGTDWEENLRSRRRGSRAHVGAAGAAGPGAAGAGFGAASAASAAAEFCTSHSVRDDDSRETPGSVVKETKTPSSSNHGSRGPTRALDSPILEGSRMALMPGGSESPASGKGPPDGVGSIRRWLQVRAALRHDS